MIHVRSLPAPLALPRIATWPLVFLGAFAVLVLRRPEALLHAQFFGEDGRVFYLPTWFSGPELLIEPYAGYLLVVPRLIAFAEWLVPPPFAPVVGTVVALALVAALAAFLASDRLAPLGRTGRYALAAAVILWPGAWDMLGVPAAIGTYLAVYLVALNVARCATSRLGIAHDVTATILAGLTGPWVIFIAPLYWIRRNRLTWLVTALALTQVAVVLVTPQSPMVVPDLGVIWETVALRVNVAFLGPRLAAPAPEWIALGLLVAAAFILYRTRRPWPWVYAGIAVGGAAVLRIGEALALYVGADERYFLLAFLAAVMVVVAGMQHGTTRPVALLLAAVMVIGALPDMRLRPFPVSDWATESQCIGGPEPCSVEVFPGGPNWTLEWSPSRGGR